MEVMETWLYNANCAESNNVASHQYEKKKTTNSLEFHRARVHIWIRKTEVKFSGFSQKTLHVISI